MDDSSSFVKELFNHTQYSRALFGNSLASHVQVNNIMFG